MSLDRHVLLSFALLSAATVAPFTGCASSPGTPDVAAAPAQGDPPPPASGVASGGNAAAPGGGEQAPWQPTGERWSDPATWGGAVPPPGSDVVVPKGKRIVLDVDATVGSLAVDGTLLCADAPVALTARGVVVAGALQCGSNDAPFTRSFVVTLTGARAAPADDPSGMGTKGVVVVAGGALDLYGEPRPAWLHLGATASAGATSLTLEHAAAFRAGDRIVVASTDFEMGQTEERVVTGVSGGVVTLDQPLAYTHFGEIQKYGAKVLDERAEVAILNRSIRIQGDDASVADAFGGHVMTMAGGAMHIDSVELTRMGQQGLLGRYPLHWHRAGDVKGQFIRRSAIHHTYHRCITVHATDNALVQGNTCFDNVGHAFFLEDGVERGNVLEDNLGLVTRRPPAGKATRPSDTANRGTDRLGPSTFWISNGDNHLRRNVAAGSDGSGFWLGPDAKPLGPSAGVPLSPLTTTVTEFDANVTHSDAGMAMVIGASPDGDGASSIYVPKSPARFTRLTYYKTRARGVWSHAHHTELSDAVMADNVRGAFFSFETLLENSLIVGESANVGTPVTPLEKTLGRSLADPKGAVVGYVLYDGPVVFRNVTFEGLGRGDANVSAFSNNGAAVQSAQNLFSQIHIAADTKNLFPLAYDFDPSNGSRHGAIVDVDGTIAGQAGRVLLPGIPFNLTPRCAKGPWTSALWASCDEAFRVLRITPSFGLAAGAPLPLIDVRRSDGPQISVGSSTKIWYQVGVVSGPAYAYRVTYPATAKATRLDLTQAAATDAVVVELANTAATATAKIGATAVPLATSLADLTAGPVGRSFRSGTSLYVKLGAAPITVQ